MMKRQPKDGFRQLVATYERPLYWHIRRMVVSHDDAADVLQETFIRAWRNMDALKAASSLRCWLLKIATNESLRLLDLRKRHPQELLEGHDAAVAAYIDYDNALAVALQRAIVSLPKAQSIVFTLRYYDELDYSEIAEIADMSVESARTNYVYAKKRIKEYIRTNVIA